MLPIVSSDQAEKVFKSVFKDVHGWRKKMIHYVKSQNPEINTAIIKASDRTELDPKAIALGAYMTYMLIEYASKEEIVQ